MSQRSDNLKRIALRAWATTKQATSLAWIRTSQTFSSLSLSNKLMGGALLVCLITIGYLLLPTKRVTQISQPSAPAQKIDGPDPDNLPPALRTKSGPWDNYGVEGRTTIPSR